MNDVETARCVLMAHLSRGCGTRKDVEETAFMVAEAIVARVAALQPCPELDAIVAAFKRAKTTL